MIYEALRVLAVGGVCEIDYGQWHHPAGRFVMKSGSEICSVAVVQ
jgi:hypothetical protein